MIGKFIGKDSMGFKNGCVHNLKSDIKNIRKGNIFSKKIPCICIYDKNSKAWCPYESFNAVLNNWILYK